MDSNAQIYLFNYKDNILTYININLMSQIVTKLITIQNGKSRHRTHNKGRKKRK